MFLTKNDLYIVFSERKMRELEKQRRKEKDIAS